MIGHGPLLQFAVLAGSILAIKLSLLMAIGEYPLRRWLADRTPAVRTRVTWWLLTTPALAGVTYAAATIALPSVLHDSERFATACSAHAESLLHLCLWHPGANDGSLWLWMIMAMLAGYLCWLAARALGSLWRIHRTLTALLRLSRRPYSTQALHVLAADQPLAFACGLGRGHILLSTSLLERLDPTQLRVVLAHEQAHVAHRDVLYRLMAVVLSSIQLPGTRRHLLRDLELAMEQRSDAVAAATVGSAVVVAETIVKVERMFRANVPERAPLSMAFFSGFVAERVEALLSPSSKASSWPAATLAFGVLSFCALSSGWLHHVTEFFIALTAG